MSKTRLVEVIATMKTPYMATFRVPVSVTNEELYSYLRVMSVDELELYEFESHDANEEWIIAEVNNISKNDELLWEHAINHNVSVEEIEGCKDV